MVTGRFVFHKANKIDITFHTNDTVEKVMDGEYYPNLGQIVKILLFSYMAEKIAS